MKQCKAVLEVGLFSRSSTEFLADLTHFSDLDCTALVSVGAAENASGTGTAHSDRVESKKPSEAGASNWDHPVGAAAKVENGMMTVVARPLVLRRTSVAEHETGLPAKQDLIAVDYERLLIVSQNVTIFPVVWSQKADD